MRTVELATMYVALGVLIGTVWGAVDIRHRWLDALLLVPMWPIYGPLLWWSGSSSFATSLVEEPADVVARIEEGHRRIERIDALLAQPDFCLREAEARVEKLGEVGTNPRALAAAQARRAALRRLGGLRNRLSDELAAIAEMRAQLSVQSALLTLADEPRTELESLVTDLAHRADGLALLLAEDLTADVGGATTSAAEPASEAETMR